MPLVKSDNHGPLLLEGDLFHVWPFTASGCSDQSTLIHRSQVHSGTWQTQVCELSTPSPMGLSSCSTKFDTIDTLIVFPCHLPFVRGGHWHLSVMSALSRPQFTWPQPAGLAEFYSPLITITFARSLCARTCTLEGWMHLIPWSCQVKLVSDWNPNLTGSAILPKPFGGFIGIITRNDSGEEKSEVLTHLTFPSTAFIFGVKVAVSWTTCFWMFAFTGYFTFKRFFFLLLLFFSSKWADVITSASFQMARFTLPCCPTPTPHTPIPFQTHSTHPPSLDRSDPNPWGLCHRFASSFLSQTNLEIE